MRNIFGKTLILVAWKRTVCFTVAACSFAPRAPSSTFLLKSQITKSIYITGYKNMQGQLGYKRIIGFWLRGLPAHQQFHWSSLLSHTRPPRLGDEAACKPAQLMREAAVCGCPQPRTEHESALSRSRSRAFGRGRPLLRCEQRPVVNPAVHRLRPEPREGRLLPGSDRRHRVRRPVHELDRSGRLRGALPGQRDRGTQSLPQPGRQDPTLVLLQEPQRQSGLGLLWL